MNQDKLPIRLRPRYWVSLVQLLVVWGFIAFIWYMSKSSTGFGLTADSIAHYFFLMCLAVMGVIGTISTLFEIIKLIPGSTAVEVREEGYLLRIFFKSHLYPWSDFDSFFTAPYIEESRLRKLLPGSGFMKRVCWNYSEAYKARIEARTKGTPREGRWRQFTDARRAKTGYEGRLAFNFNMSADRLAELMERTRARAVNGAKSRLDVN